jgi:hypothetical protein
MPGKGEEPLRFHFLDDRLPSYMLVPGMKDLPFRDLAGNKRTFQFDPKPLSKLTVIGEGPPYTGNRGLEFNPFFDGIFHFKQPLGCILTKTGQISNRLVAIFRERLRLVSGRL